MKIQRVFDIYPSTLWQLSFGAGYQRETRNAHIWFEFQIIVDSLFRFYLVVLIRVPSPLRIAPI